VNTFIALAIDARTRRPSWARDSADFQTAIKPVALRMVYEAAQAVKIPVIGLGGIASGTDAAEFLIAERRGGGGHREFLGSGRPVRIAGAGSVFGRREDFERGGVGGT